MKKFTYVNGRTAHSPRSGSRPQIIRCCISGARKNCCLIQAGETHRPDVKIRRVSFLSVVNVHVVSHDRLLAACLRKDADIPFLPAPLVLLQSLMGEVG
ncbi:hypothetical protein ACLBX9_29650 [Methylobacterium sp. A49B]